jgi:hypothetical protein
MNTAHNLLSTALSYEIFSFFIFSEVKKKLLQSRQTIPYSVQCTLYLCNVYHPKISLYNIKVLT